MANTLNDTTWLIDTAGPALISAESVDVVGVLWTPGGPGEQIVIKNGLGQIVFQFTSDSAVGFPLTCNIHWRAAKGFAVTTLTSGTMVLFLKVS